MPNISDIQKRYIENQIKDAVKQTKEYERVRRYAQEQVEYARENSERVSEDTKNSMKGSKGAFDPSDGPLLYRNGGVEVANASLSATPGSGSKLQIEPPHFGFSATSFKISCGDFSGRVTLEYNLNDSLTAPVDFEKIKYSGNYKNYNCSVDSNSEFSAGYSNNGYGVSANWNYGNGDWSIGAQYKGNSGNTNYSLGANINNDNGFVWASISGSISF